ncbi:GTPase-activating protein [Colwellia sp. MSW7]|jgi:ribosome assembly protein YihI (activator of Der GTPase)|uniref:GTPase-activating protein n=1 Tax=Colwellia maritima TaxID=2912588 RepID=A0ABS9WW53_9GAMM|nr:Der GTPase-activating protein YihI [Colwellia maritima]MCI2282113.1 GTPase-activating protein [Colwellia maritima]
MSRTKKSRKPGGAPTAKPKLSKVELASVEKRVRKKTGKKPGNRQQEAQIDNQSDHNTNQNKDPRIGSKKPIDLGGAVKIVQKPISNKAKKAPKDPIAAIRTVNKDEVELSLAQQLEAIETDERLQVILSKQEEEITLTAEEVDYFNNLMDRHQSISAQLDDDDEEIPATKAKSEDDLWDKLDNSSLSDSLYGNDNERD